MALLKGGGGTDMNPIFDELEERKIKPGVTIVITDGHIGQMRDEPTFTKVIWVVVGASGNTRLPWGEVVHVTED